MRAKTFQIGGTIDPTEKVYIERAIDATFLKLLRGGNHCNLHAGRQSGKTSLMKNVRDQLSQDGHWCIDIDFSAIFHDIGLTQGLLVVFDQISRKLNRLTERASADWLQGIKMLDMQSRIEEFFSHLVAVIEPGKRLYLFFDETDALMCLPSADLYDFLSACVLSCKTRTSTKIGWS